MKKFEPIQWFIVKQIRARERLEKARALAGGEKAVVAQSDALYHGKASFRDEFDTKDLQSYMNLD